MTVAARIASTSSNWPENSRPANTSRFLTHSCGRMATITALQRPAPGLLGPARGDRLLAHRGLLLESGALHEGGKVRDRPGFR